MRTARGPAAALLSLALAGGALASAPADFRLAQAVQGAEPTVVHAYLDVWDADEAPVTTLDAAAVTASLGGQPMTVRRVAPFAGAGEGVAFIFAVDISKSLQPQDFAQIRSALGRWVDGLGPLDRAAVLTFGDQSRLLLDFTGDRATLRAAVDTLAPTDMTTVLYTGVLAALELSSRRDPDLPSRRVLVILSDGKDEGSGLEPEDVLAALRERGLPLYAIGFGGSSGRDSLDLLLRFAVNSGGRFVAVSGRDFEAAYDAVRAAVDRVWLAELECAGCSVDGAARRLQVNLELEDRVLSKGADLRLLPPLATPLAAPVAEEASEAAAPAAGEEASAGTAAPARRWLLPAAAAAVAALLLVAIALRKRSRSTEEERGESPARPRKRRAKLSRRERKALDVPLGSAPMVAPVPICFTVVRGSEVGAEHRFLLERRAVLGSGRKSDLTIADPGLAAEQVELAPENGEVAARNLCRDQPTLLNGAPLRESKLLKGGDLLGNRDFIVRVRLG